MREIKFRAWDRTNKVIIEKPYLHLVDGESFYLAEKGSTPRSDLEFELMQYTGLKDKNGKEIYEGDIVDYTGSEIPGDEHNLVRVVWGDLTGWELEDYAMRIPEFYQEELEVIDNIYENKELLNFRT